jgi:hypothetical protein
MFSDLTNKTGIIQACERYCNLGSGKISGDTTLLQDFTNFTNITLSRIWHTVFLATGSWEYDDSNYSDLPQATANLVSGTSKYALPSPTLTIKRVEMKDSSGEWFVLTPLLRDEIKVAIDEYRVADGLPTSYRLLGDTMEIFPASNYNSTGGLKVYFDRGSVSFSTTDTTKTAGFASEYHDLVPLGASLEWLKIHLPEWTGTAQFKEDYAIRIQQLKEYYNRRFPAKKKIMRRLHQTFK